MTGCLDDKTNHDYSEINAVEISNIGSSYTIFKGEELRISPEVAFSMEGVSPDVSYEWWFNMELYSEEKDFVYKGGEIGEHTLLFCVTDNATGVKYHYKDEGIRLVVQTVYKYGFMVLSDDDGRSMLSMIKTKTVPTESGDADSLVVVGANIDIFPTLGRGPVRLLEHGLMDDYAIEEVMVVQERTMELDGNSMQAELYTDQEFSGSAPAGFRCVNAILSGGSNYLLGADGHVYYSINAEGFYPHTGFYSPEPLHNGNKYTQLIQTNLTDNDFILAVEESSNSLVGLVVAGYDNGYGLNLSNMYDGKLARIVDDSSYDMTLFKDPDHKWERLYTTWYEGYGMVSILRERATNKYYAHTFEFYMSGYRYSEVASLEIDGWDLRELDPEPFTDFRCMATFPFRYYGLVASGKTLYRIGYRDWDEDTAAIKTFDSPIVQVAVKDHAYWSDESVGGPLFAVALENGEVHVFKMAGDDPADFEEVFRGGGFGKVVDLKFKWSNTIVSNWGLHVP